MLTKIYCRRNRSIFIALLVGFLILFSTLNERELPSVEAQAVDTPVVELEDCPAGAEWKWTSGPAQPDTARQAESDLSRENITSTIIATGFGEEDGCGNFKLYATDFAVEIKGNAILSSSEKQALGDKVLPVLSRYAKPKLGNVRIDFDSGGNTFYPGSPSTFNVPPMSTAPLSNESVLNKKVYVLVYDPILKNGQHLSEYIGWYSYETLVQSIIDFMQVASHGQMQYSVAYTSVVTNEWPVKIDGFRYTEETYLAMLQHQAQPHDPDTVNYDVIIDDPRFDLCGKLNRGEIDELWVYGFPWSGFYESRLVGPDAYWLNSPPVSGTHTCNSLLPIMGLNYERGLPEAIESFGHRTESTMTKTYGDWQENRTAHNWDRFGLVKAQSPNYSYSGCGSIHYSPNSTKDYEHDNPTPVLSNCDDFRNYPNLSDPLAVAQPVTCTAWNCNFIDYFMYWYGHFPSVSGCTAAIGNNWWEYFADPDLAIYPSLACPAPTCPTITAWKGEYWTNSSLLGPAAVCRNDPDIDFTWNLGSPDPLIPVDNFSARWTRTISFNSETYRFHLYHDDGAKIFIDNLPIAGGDFWNTCCVWETVDYSFSAGSHTVRLDMFEGGWDASARLWWEQLYKLKVGKTGTGNGTITSNPAGIHCGSDCEEAYTHGELVTLNAEPALDSVFKGWSGNEDCLDGTVTMDAGKTCTAAFDLANYTLTINKSGTGSGTITSTPPGIDCGSDCSESYVGNTRVTLNVQPEAGSIFHSWGGACEGTAASDPCKLTMLADTSVRATFVKPCPDCGPANSAWPLYRQNTRRTGRSPYIGPTSPGLLWSYDAFSYDGSSAAIGSDGTIYVGLSNKLYAFNQNGEVKWIYPMGGLVRSPAIAGNGTVYASADNGIFYALNPDGSLKWTFTTGSWISDSPAITPDGILYFGSSNGYFYALWPNGTLKWSYLIGSWQNPSPAIGLDGTIYQASTTRSVYALTSSGQLKWEYPTESYVDATPALGADGTVYIGSLDHYLYALNPDGTLKWRYDTGNEVGTAAIGADGTIYVGNLDSYLFALNPNGTRKWKYYIGDYVHTPSIDNEGTIYVGANDSYLYAFNPAGSLKWRFLLGGNLVSTPVIGSDNTIYITSGGTLFAIGSCHTLAINVNPDGSGNVNANPPPNCDHGTRYKQNTIVTLTASPTTGTTFTGWSGGGCSGTGSCILTMTEVKSITANFGQGQHQTFVDVPTSHPYYQDIEILYANGLTSGCQTSPPKFCPDKIMNRAEAAAFNLRAHFGPIYVPPAATHIFVDDWTKGPWGEPWAEGMKLNGYSAGCQVNPPKYCPWNQIPREQAVIFALKIKYGKDYTPPPATGTLFADMTNTSFYATAWAEQAYREGLIPSCGISGGKPKICPKTLVSRGLAAYMIVRAKNLSMP